MNVLAPKKDVFLDRVYLQVAREVAMDIHDLPTILKNNKLTDEDWQLMSESPYFQNILQHETVLWNSSLNTSERVKAKAQAVMEQWIEEAFNVMHDKGETLTGRVKTAELLTKLAGMGSSEVSAQQPGERLTITINMGADQQLRVEKQLPARVIDHAGPDMDWHEREYEDDAETR